MEFSEILISIYDKRTENIRRAKTMHLRYGFNIADTHFNINNAVVIIYANWEGFIKEASTEYINYINSQQVAIDDFDDHYYMLVLDQHLEFKKNIESNDVMIKKCCLLRKALSNFSGFNTAVNTKSNANCDVVNKIFYRLGIKEIIRKELFDKPLNRLLFFRNCISHGTGSIKVTQNDIDDFSFLTQNLMAIICEKLINAVSNSIWLRPDKKKLRQNH